MAEFMFQNVVYRATVYRTGALSDWESVQGSGFNAHNTVPVSESRGRTSGENQLNILLIYQSDRMPLHNSAICIQSTVHIYGSD